MKAPSTMRRSLACSLSLFIAGCAASTPPGRSLPPSRPAPPPEAALVSRTLPPPPTVDELFIRLYTESRHFKRGTPSGSTVTGDGATVFFLRSAARESAQSLYEMDVATGAVRTLVTPETVAPGPETMTQEERARRERLRISASGFAWFEVSRDAKTVVVSLSGKLYALDRPTGVVRPLPTRGGAIVDPRLSPDGSRVAYVQDDDVHVVRVDGRGTPLRLTLGGTRERPHGLADFIASEELERHHGFFWSPDSSAVLFEEADASAVEQLTIGDPSHPEQPGDRVAYPRPGRANASLRFGLTRLSSPGVTTWVEWDRATFPYVAGAAWDAGAPPSLVVLDRLQKNEAFLIVDAKTGKTTVGTRDDDDAWVNAGGAGLRGGGGSTRWLPDGSAFVWWTERDGDGRLALVGAGHSAPDGANEPRWLTPSGAQVATLLDLDSRPGARAAVVESTRDGLHVEVDRVPLDGGQVTPLVRLADGAVHAWFGASHDVFLTHETSLSGGDRYMVRSLDGKVAREIPSVAAQAPLPHVTLEDVGPDGTHVAIVRPNGYVEAARYPVIDSAYAGPHAQVVTLDPKAYVLEQWMADATGAVVVRIDGKGTPGRGRAWERALAGKLGQLPLDEHVAALRALESKHPELDASRVGVYGWSFGGYFSAFALLQRPDVFSAAVAIAPVTEWRNYDTAYTERYLGLPSEASAAYDAASVLVAARTSPKPATPRPLMLVHGTADDNVYFFHSLELADALAKAGRPFTFLPMIGQTHAIASPDAQAAVWLAAARTLQVALRAPSSP